MLFRSNAFTNLVFTCRVRFVGNGRGGRYGYRLELEQSRDYTREKRTARVQIWALSSRGARGGQKPAK